MDSDRRHLVGFYLIIGKMFKANLLEICWGLDGKTYFKCLENGGGWEVAGRRNQISPRREFGLFRRRSYGADIWST